MKRSSSRRWLKEHFSDPYVKRAKKEGFRARSIYKLKEINERYNLIKPNMLIVDLGSAPGGWSEYAAPLVAPKGKVFSLDILPMKDIKGVDFIQGDFTQDQVVNSFHELLAGQKVDLVLSDIAPNLSGVKIADQMKAIGISEQVLDFATKVLKPKGSFIIKAFHGAGFDEFFKELKQHFDEVKTVKPDASRARSSEVFLLAKGFKPS